MRSVARGRHALWGACDPLITPRPLGPLRDVARQVGGALAAAVADGSREDVLAAALDALADAALLVIEDLHWADDATLDVVALLGRRLDARLPRPHLPAGRAAARSGACSPRCRPTRIEPGALSAAAVARARRARGPRRG